MDSQTKQQEFGNKFSDPDSDHKKVRVLLTCLTIVLSVLSVPLFLLSKEIWILIIMNAPLLTVMSYYFPKRHK